MAARQDGQAAEGLKARPYALLAVLLLIHVIAHIDRSLLLGFSQQITSELSMSNAQYGFLAGAVWVLSFGVMAVLLGSLADRFNRFKVIAGGVLVWSACTALSGSAQSFEQMAAARFFVASGEAALVPAAISLLMEVFDRRRVGTAIGIFFVSIPLGLGIAFMIAGLLDTSLGWRGSYHALGLIGLLVGVPLLFLKDQRSGSGEAQRGAPLRQQMRNLAALLRGNPALIQIILGFVLINLAYVGVSFLQLWLVRDHGLDPAEWARRIGVLGIVCGAIGSLLGGIGGDRLGRHVPGGYAAFIALLIVLCTPLMMVLRFAVPGSAIFYIGLCASLFLPMAAYAPVQALLQARTPDSMRSTITGVAMLATNLFSIAIGSTVIGAVSDRLTAGGVQGSLTWVLLASDALVMLGALAFLLSARGGQDRNAVMSTALVRD